jgi:hypothetical protein
MPKLIEANGLYFEAPDEATPEEVGQFIQPQEERDPLSVSEEGVQKQVPEGATPPHGSPEFLQALGQRSLEFIQGTAIFSRWLE